MTTPALCGFLVHYPADDNLGTPAVWFRCNETGILRSNTPIKRTAELAQLIADQRLQVVRELNTGATIYRIIETPLPQEVLP
jgi:hypothetical protein